VYRYRQRPRGTHPHQQQDVGSRRQQIRKRMARLLPPLLACCVHDQGPKLVGSEFRHMLAVNGIKDVPTTVKNPQSNAIAERLHRTVEDIIRTLLHGQVPNSQLAAEEVIDTTLATASHAIRTAIHTTMKISPGAVVFHRDMILPLPLVVDFEVLHLRRQVLIDENLRRQNLRRRDFDYTVGAEVLLLDQDPNRRKLDPFGSGPFVVHQVHTNGTVTILRKEGVFERINIRRLRPYERATHEVEG